MDMGDRAVNCYYRKRRGRDVHFSILNTPKSVSVGKWTKGMVSQRVAGSQALLKFLLSRQRTGRNGLLI